MEINFEDYSLEALAGTTFCAGIVFYGVNKLMNVINTVSLDKIKETTQSMLGSTVSLCGLSAIALPFFAFDNFRKGGVYGILNGMVFSIASGALGAMVYRVLKEEKQVAGIDAYQKSEK